MKGILVKKQDGQWTINYALKTETGYPDTHSIPLHPEDASHCLDADHGTLVHFNEVDEFGHHELYKNIGWGDGETYAKLVHESEDWDTKPGFVEKRSAQFMNEIHKLTIKYPNDAELGRQIRQLFND